MSVEHFQLARELNIDKVDLLLLCLAIQVIRESGHRYGTFLDSASTAAKFSIYITFLEKGRNFRRTGIAHHVEPKRVKAIVKEVECALKGDNPLKGVGSLEPSYLLSIPHLWKEQYPWNPGKNRISNRDFNESEERQISSLVPVSFPNTLLIGEGELMLLIEKVCQDTQHHRSQERNVVCSESLFEHIKYQLLYSETIIEISVPFIDVPLFALASHSYSPKGQQSRLDAMMDDVIRFIHLLQQWVNEEPDAFRAIETLAILPSRREQAFQELDQLLRDWGDKYHCQNGDAVILQMALGKAATFMDAGS